MLTGLDTGFFFALQEQHPLALQIWGERPLVTSVVVLYEMQKKILKGEMQNLLDQIEKAMKVIPLTSELARKAGHLAHGIGIPALDAMILVTLVDAGCREIYTTDRHLLAYKRKGMKILSLAPAKAVRH